MHVFIFPSSSPRCPNRITHINFPHILNLTSTKLCVNKHCQYCRFLYIWCKKHQINLYLTIVCLGITAGSVPPRGNISPRPFQEVSACQNASPSSQCSPRQQNLIQNSDQSPAGRKEQTEFFSAKNPSQTRPRAKRKHYRKE